MRNTVAVIDDEPDILHLVSLHLKKALFEVEGYGEAQSFLASLSRKIPDLIILDLMLPDMDGLELCTTLKQDVRYAPIPLIMLTAKGAEHERISGLELGADDYVTKPFSPRELVARVRAVLRRSQPGEEGPLVVEDRLFIDAQKFEVTLDGTPVRLTPVEFRILHLLAASPGRVFTREKILDHLWGNEKAVLDRTVDVHIRNLREKLGKTGGLIQNVRGVGYKLERA